eukprot:3027718-Pyramimonas_sp.AAC.1
MGCALYVVPNHLCNSREALHCSRNYPSAQPHNLGCEAHAAAIAMSAWCWRVHLCGRASPRVLALAAAG